MLSANKLRSVSRRSSVKDYWCTSARRLRGTVVGLHCEEACMVCQRTLNRETGRSIHQTTSKSAVRCMKMSRDCKVNPQPAVSVVYGEHPGNYCRIVRAVRYGAWFTAERRGRAQTSIALRRGALAAAMRIGDIMSCCPSVLQYCARRNFV